ncbi:hypothetical protein [Streptomyces ossamyceticus]|uniref:hypothetical protein n=1 Tax=Streptomyces ossamyceticus TaxID=249581 RepID=UPI00342E0601
MTLAAAWVRKTGGARELVVASDSRLSGGETWDRAPKIFELPRTDAVIAFTGSTSFALPAVMQLVSAISAYPPSRRRSSDLEAAKGHALAVFNEIYSNRRDYPSSGNPGPEADFILAGWSWRAAQFRIWYLAWDSSEEKFKFRAVKPWRKRENVWCWFAGSENAVRDARRSLEIRLAQNGKSADSYLNYEPLEIIAEACFRQNYRDIGGAPQVTKVYQHMNVQQFAVEWPVEGSTEQARSLYLGGRPLLSYEVAFVPVLRGEYLGLA